MSCAYACLAQKADYPGLTLFGWTILYSLSVYSKIFWNMRRSSCTISSSAFACVHMWMMLHHARG